MTTKTKTAKTSARRASSSTKKASKSARRDISPRSAIRERLEKSGRDAAFAFGVKLKGMSEATVRRYIAFFLSKKGKTEAKKAAKKKAA
jgi:hypothetical protein